MARIGYRRMSGAIGISDHERGSRGLWWEKRRALVAWLRARGHQLDWVGRLTKFSQQARDVQLGADHSHLLIEFGSPNTRFYGKDLDDTQRLADAHAARGGQVVFICDDPDLPYLWDRVPAAQQGAWAVWANMAYPAPFGGQPAAVPTYDLPVHVLQPSSPAQPPPQPTPAAYIGRPLGRSRVLRQLLAAQVPFQVFGRAAEWKDFALQVAPAPDQPQRAAFYAQQSAALVLADGKHKRLGWRTGRAYHALAAGCPPLVERDHPALASQMASWADPAGLKHLVATCQQAEERAGMVRAARYLAWGEHMLLLSEHAAEAVGL